MTDTLPLEPFVRDYLHRRVNEGNSYIKTPQIAKDLGVDSHDVVPIVKRLRADGTLEVWSDSTNTPAVYRIANGGEPAASSVSEPATDGGGKARCLAPTTRTGDPCKNTVLEPFDRCSLHLDFTEAADALEDPERDQDQADADGRDRDVGGVDRPVWERQHDELLGGEV